MCRLLVTWPPWGCARSSAMTDRMRARLQTACGPRRLRRQIIKCVFDLPGSLGQARIAERVARRSSQQRADEPREVLEQLDRIRTRGPSGRRQQIAVGEVAL